jgi:hypothetical protein
VEPRIEPGGYSFIENQPLDSIMKCGDFGGEMERRELGDDFHNPDKPCSRNLIIDGGRPSDKR